MKTNSKTVHWIFTAFILAAVFTTVNIKAQSTLTCKVDGDQFAGKVEEAARVNIGAEKLIQIKTVDDDKILYLYIKTSKLNGNFPIELNYKNSDTSKSSMPDAEVVWVPDGPDKPQWNSVDGNLIVTNYDPNSKTISGTFNFVVEKFVYGTKAKNDRPSQKIKEGKFDSIQYQTKD